jgi:hypothetical protein
VLLPEGPRRVRLPERVPVVQPGLLMELRSARPVALRRERAQAARSAVPAGPHRGLETPARPARPSAVVARTVGLRLAVLRQEALRPAEPAVQAGEAEPQQEVQPASAARPRAARVELAVSGAGALRPEAVAVWDAAAGPQPGAAAVWDAAAGPQPGAAAVQGVAVAALPQAAVARAAVGAARRPGAAPVSEVLRRAGRDEAEPLLAAAWAALPSTRPAGERLAPSTPARSAHARGRLRTAQP